MSSDQDFSLDPRLAADTVYLRDDKLSRLLMMNDARYYWLVLVPRRSGASELHDLAPAERARLIEEAAHVGAVLKRLTGCKKINTGALGNIVRQLHMHVVARFETDPAWPGPVWGHSPREPFAPELLELRIAELLDRL